MLIEKFNTFLGRLENVKRSSETQAVASCPAHDDKNPSLSIAIIPHKKIGKDTILVNCHAGCSFESIVQKVGMEPADFFSGEDKKRFQKKRKNDIRLKLMKMEKSSSIPKLIKPRSVKLKDISTSRKTGHLPFL